MARTNPERRAALLDAAIEVLARDGARGLTFRAVDREAGVPPGTASNYFTDRDALLTQAGGHFYERLTPGPDVLRPLTEDPKDRATVTRMMQTIVDRIEAYRTGFLALLELRLEATRRPELRRVLTERVRADIDHNVRTHLDAGMPGDETTVLLLYLALNWLIVDRLTLPEIFTEEQGRALVEAAVERALGAASDR